MFLKSLINRKGLPTFFTTPPWHISSIKIAQLKLFNKDKERAEVSQPQEASMNTRFDHCFVGSYRNDGFGDRSLSDGRRSPKIHATVSEE